MEQPLVTVIITAYNHSKYIKENLDSVKNQTYKNLQLILGDDASPDNSVEVFEHWLKHNNYSAEKNFHTKNTGLAEMLNECILLAKGKYIKIFSADDFLHPEAIEKCVAELEKLGDEYGMAFSDTFAIDEESTIVEDIADYNTAGNRSSLAFRNELIKGNCIAGLAVLMTTKAVQETGKYDAKILVEDYYRWLKINEKYLICYIPEKLAYYRLHPENLSKTKAERIDIETLILQMTFDKEGVAKYRINDRTHRHYFSESKLSEEYITMYSNYPFHIKRLAMALKYKLPVPFYKFLCKII